MVSKTKPELIDISASPVDWGLPPKFSSWRPGQFDNVIRAIDSKSRFVSSCQPTGSGKSLYYMGISVMSGDRTCILTETKGLQDQLKRDFSSIGLVDIRGKANYDCNHGVGLTCEEGFEFRCPNRKSTQCPYKAAYDTAVKSPLVVTNYSYWSLVHRYGEGLGHRDTLILDEAHSAPESLNGVITVNISSRDLDRVGYDWPPSADGRTMDEWRTWARGLFAAAKDTLESAQSSVGGGRLSGRDTKIITHLKDLVRQSDFLANSSGPWIFEQSKYGYTFSPLWPGPYAEQALFFKIPKVYLTSATLRPKTLSPNLLGVKDLDIEHWEVDSTFDPKMMPTYWLDTVPVKFSMSEVDKYRWYKRIDRLIESRSDRKGLIHTVSYPRSTEFMLNCRNLKISGARPGQPHLFAPQSSSETRDDVADFKRWGDPAIIMSPSISTGYDFPFDEAEYQIIAKLPFPDSRSKIMKARQESDKEYGPYLMTQELQQMVGRIARDGKDHGETFIIDNQAAWSIGKFGKFKDYLSASFLKFYQKITEIPVAPPALFKRKSNSELKGMESRVELDDDIPF